jgi:CMP-N,N'-diacetyllegionaminic acid synthase
MTKKILSIIPARGGSKGLPRKNIIDFDSKPLIASTIEASLNSKIITKTIVSSDDDEILDISSKYKAEILKRPKNLAMDNTSSQSVVEHVLGHMDDIGEKFDFVALLQPTSPLRNHKDIDKAYKLMFDSNANAVISVCEFDSKVLKVFKKNKKGYLEGISENKFLFMARQSLPKVYMPNGAIYIISVEAFKRYGTFLTKETISYTMPKERSIDVDSASDIDLIRNFLNNQK